MYPNDLIKLITFLKKLSGVGSKTAQRFAFELLKWDDNEINNFADLLKNIKKNIFKCKTCGCLISSDEYCRFCDPNIRDTTKICIISSFKEVFLIENTKTFSGFYHIIETLSPIDGKEIDFENINILKKRIEKFKVKEIIIALDSTVEGDATSLYLKEELKEFNLNISRLAFGLPMGTSLDYIDGGTLTQALIGRQSF